MVAQQLCCLVFGVALGLATQPVDGLAVCGGGEPAAGIGWYAVAWPSLHRRDERLSGCFLGDVEVAESAHETGEYPRPLLVVGTGDRLFHGETCHGSSSAGTDRSVWEGCTLVLPLHAFDLANASIIASL